MTEKLFFHLSLSNRIALSAFLFPSIIIILSLIIYENVLEQTLIINWSLQNKNYDNVFSDLNNQ
jgi:hypothetical protein